MSVDRGRPEVIGRRPNGAFDPNSDVSHPGASTNRSVLLTSRRRLRKPRGNVMLVLSANGRPSSFSSFEPSRIVDSTAAADGENVGHIQDCGTSSG
jgi:hypothetical protein